MRILEPFVLAAALVAADAASAEPICDAIQHAARIGASDNHFAAFRGDMPAPQGFACRINIDGGLGAYACSMPVEPQARVATAKAVIEAIRACVRSSLIVEKDPKEANAVFMISRRPQSWVVVNGADDPARIYMNVVVAGRGASSGQGQPSFQVLTGREIESRYGETPYDPGVETRPH